MLPSPISTSCLYGLGKPLLCINYCTNQYLSLRASFYAFDFVSASCALPPLNVAFALAASVSLCRVEPRLHDTNSMKLPSKTAIHYRLPLTLSTSLKMRRFSRSSTSAGVIIMSASRKEMNGKPPLSPTKGYTNPALCSLALPTHLPPSSRL